jgi:hypothetical protein
MSSAGRTVANALAAGVTDGSKLLDVVLETLFVESPRVGFDGARTVLRLLSADLTLEKVEKLTTAVGREGQPTPIGQAIAAALLPLVEGGSDGVSNLPVSGVLAVSATNSRPAKVSEKSDDPPVGSAAFSRVAAATVDACLNNGLVAANALLAAARRESAWFDEAAARFSAAKPRDGEIDENCDVCLQTKPKWRCANCPRNRLFCEECWEFVHSKSSKQERARPDLSGHGRSRFGGHIANKQQTWDLYQAVVNQSGVTLDSIDNFSRSAENGRTYDEISIAIGAFNGTSSDESRLFVPLESAFLEVCQRARTLGKEVPPGFVATVTYEGSSAGANTGGYLFGEALVTPEQMATFIRSLRTIADGFGEWKSTNLRVVFAACYGKRVARLINPTDRIELAAFDGPHPSDTLLQTIEVLTSCSWDLRKFVMTYNSCVLAPWKEEQGSVWRETKGKGIRGYILTGAAPPPPPPLPL